MQTTQHQGQHTTAGEEVAPYRDGVAIGLFAVVVSTFGVMAAVGEVFPDALVFTVVFTGLAIAALRSRSAVLRWVIAGLMTIFIGVNLIFAVSDLAHPESAAPFIATVAVLACGSTTIALAVLAARRRAVPALRVWPVVGVVLALVAGTSLVAAAQVEDDVAQPGDTIVVAEDYEFPAQVEVSSSGGVLISNADRGRHTFLVEGEVDPVEIPGGSDVRVDLELDPGTYRYYCDVVGHEDMEGTLVVQ